MTMYLDCRWHLEQAHLPSSCTENPARIPQVHHDGVVT